MKFQILISRMMQEIAGTRDRTLMSVVAAQNGSCNDMFRIRFLLGVLRRALLLRSSKGS